MLQQYVKVLPASTIDARASSGSDDISVKPLMESPSYTHSTSQVRIAQTTSAHLDQESQSLHLPDDGSSSSSSGASPIKLPDAPLKMPTPVTRKRPFSPVHDAQTAMKLPDRAKSRTETEEISQDELNTRLAAFVRDKRNIKLCEAVEKFWVDAGMPR